MTHSKKLLSIISSRLNNKVLFIIALIIAFALTATDIMIVSTNENKNGTINSFFCGVDDCPKLVSDEIKSAGKTIDCAFYDLDNPIIISALSNKSSEVRLILEKGNLNKIPPELNMLLHKISYKNDSNPNYMHNKFCIIGDTVTTGSFNPTDNDAYRNNNNLVIINSEEISKIFEDEFNEMWDGKFGKGDKNELRTIEINDNSSISAFFCPEDHCSENIVRILEMANESIYFMSFSFTDQMIANALVNMNKKNIIVSGIIEKNQANVQESRYDFLKYHNINITFDNNKYFMHHKVFIIDEKIVITGSMNPTNAGNLRNDENIVIINDKNIAERFINEFERIVRFK